MNFTSERIRNSKPLINWKLKDLYVHKSMIYILCGVLIFASSSVLITIIAIQIPKIYTENYAVVVDAGSTGSRAYLYKWKDSADEINDIVTELSNCKADKLQKLDWTDPNNGLVGCISNVIADIPSGFMNRPYIYVASTAGMRLYQKEHPKETDLIFKNIESVFANMNWRSRYVGIISGEVEGISAWITANILKNKIGKDIQRQETVGAIDLGGSSTQIAYETLSSPQKITLYNQEYSVFGASYLCYGTNMFYLKYMTYVAVTSSEQSFNCLLKNSPVGLKADVKVCRYNGSENLNFASVSKKASPDPVKCYQQISALVDSELTFVKPPQGAKFVAISSFYYVYKFLGKYFGSIGNMSRFQQSIAEFCREDFNDIPNKYKSEQRYAGVYCVIGTYITKLFSSYGITDLSNLEFTDKIDRQNVGWNLGYMIDKTRSIPASYIHRLSQPLFMSIVVMVSLVFTASVLLLGYLVAHNRGKSRDSVV